MWNFATAGKIHFVAQTAILFGNLMRPNWATEI